MKNIIGIILILALAFAFPIYLIIREILKKRTLDNASAHIIRELYSDEISWLQSQKTCVPLISENYAKDLTEKIWKIEGKVFVETVRSGSSYTYIITIGKVEFNLMESQSERFMKNFGQIKQGEKISIEYSPFSKHIWKIYK